MNVSFRQLRTLVIDDFQGMRTMLCDFVKAMGVTQVETANNGREALRMLAGSSYDVVICDFNLGSGANGQQVLEEAKLRNLVGVSSIWAIVTAEKTAEMVMGAAEIKPDDYLIKPINQVFLQARLEKLVLRKQALGAVESAMRAKDYPAAIAHCDDLLKTPVVNRQEILRIQSDLMLTIGDFAAARGVFESVLSQRQVSWAKTGLGRLLFYQQDYAGARELFLQVLSDNRMYVEAADWLARTCEAMGDSAQAQSVLEDAVKLSPNSPLRQKHLGDTAMKNGALDVAQQAFEKNIRISEFSVHKTPVAYVRLAQVLSDKGEAQEALKVLKRSKVDFRFNPAAGVQTAAAESRVYQKMGMTAPAQSALATAEQLAQQLAQQLQGQLSPDLQVELAHAQLRLGQKEKACQTLSQVVKNNHENSDLTRAIESVFEQENLAEEGRALVQASRQEVTEINNQGVLLAKQGAFAPGAQLLRSALDKLPGSEVLLINLCGLLIAQMNRDGYRHDLAAEVRQSLEQVRQINPGNPKYHSYTLMVTRLQRG